MNIIRLIGSEFVGIINGIPYSSNDEQDMIAFFEEFNCYQDVNEIITDGMNLLNIVLGYSTWETEQFLDNNKVISAIWSYYQERLKEKADFIIGTNTYEED